MARAVHLRHAAIAWCEEDRARRVDRDAVADGALGEDRIAHTVESDDDAGHWRQEDKRLRIAP